MIANTILQRLGGHGFTVMTGSRNYINLSNGLQMSLARNKTSANRLKIILDEDTDTYTFLSSDTDEVCGHQGQGDSQIRGSVL